MRGPILDTLVAAVTGYLGYDNLTTLPVAPELDSRGRPMEIVFYAPEKEAAFGGIGTTIEELSPTDNEAVREETWTANQYDLPTVNRYAVTVQPT